MKGQYLWIVLRARKRPLHLGSVKPGHDYSHHEIFDEVGCDVDTIAAPSDDSILSADISAIAVFVHGDEFFPQIPQTSIPTSREVRAGDSKRFRQLRTERTPPFPFRDDSGPQRLRHDLSLIGPLSAGARVVDNIPLCPPSRHTFSTSWRNGTLQRWHLLIRRTSSRHVQWT